MPIVRKIFILLVLTFSWNNLSVAQTTYDIMVMLEPNVAIHSFCRSIGSWAYIKHDDSQVPQQISSSMNIWKLQVQSKESKDQFMQLIRNHTGVIAAQFDQKAFLRGEVLANDLLFNQQWNLRNIGQAGGKPGADCKASFAWSLPWKRTTTSGDTIVVAVIDDMFDTAINEINWFRNKSDIPNNGFDDDANGYIDDHYGWNTLSDDGNVQINSTANYHGSHVAGIIGAYGNNDTGMAGIHWGVKILPIVGANISNVSDIIQAYNYVIDQKRLYLSSLGSKGAFIVATNSSFGIDNQFQVDQPIWCAMYDSMGKYGILSTAATTNALSDVDVSGDIPSTCASEFLIMTSASNFMDQHTTRGYGKKSIDLHAPGEGIFSTNPGKQFTAKSGTSFASPHVAGAISFLFGVAGNKWMSQYQSNMSGAILDVKQAILKGVDTIAGLANRNLTSGRLNLYKAALWMQQKDSVLAEINPLWNEEDKVEDHLDYFLFLSKSKIKTITAVNLKGQAVQMATPINEFTFQLDKQIMSAGIYMIIFERDNGQKNILKLKL